MSQDIQKLRDKISEIDAELIDLLGKRFALSAEIGRLKDKLQLPIVIESIEKPVIARARAAESGVSADTMESIFREIIKGSVETQER
ncbi:MAG: chorismate mutase [bacterium]|nr:chorismate mutase [bacterium]MCP4800913.1 chorismate mutase [bacterium]